MGFSLLNLDAEKYTYLQGEQMELLCLGLGLFLGCFGAFAIVSVREQKYKEGQGTDRQHLLRRSERLEAIYHKVGDILNGLQKVIFIVEDLNNPESSSGSQDIAKIKGIINRVHNLLRESLLLHDNEETINRATSKPSATAVSKLIGPVLLVEDDILLLNAVRGMTQKMGIECDSVESGEKAIEMVKMRNYQLILMDYSLPGIDGCRTSELIRQSKNGRNTVIIALTGRALRGDKEQMLSSGMNDYLSKPFKPVELKILINKYFSVDLKDAA